MSGVKVTAPHVANHRNPPTHCISLMGYSTMGQTSYLIFLRFVDVLCRNGMARYTVRLNAEITLGLMLSKHE